MSLTRVRATNILDIDYKASCRTTTLTNITLSGGAPNSVDGVNLSLGDRILVQGQGTASQNGIYRVSVVGTGSDGTWVRDSDATQNGSLSAGVLTYIEAGNDYGGKFYYLTTTGNIIIGSTNLSFTELSTGGGGSTYSNSNVAAYLPIYTGNITAGNITTLSGGQLIGYHTGAIGANVANTGVFTTLTTSGDAVIGGNLTVNGTTTTVNSTVTTVNDLNIVLANNAATASAANGAGLTINGANATLTYVSASNNWTFDRTVTAQLFTGPLSGPLNGTVGATTPNTGVFTAVTTISGGQLIGYHTGPIGANATNTGAFTTITASSTLNVTGTSSFAGTVTAATINASSIGNTGATLTGTHNGPLNGPHNGTVGATTPNTGAFTTITASGNVNFDSGLLFADSVSNRVGIGNTSPTHVLSVTGNAAISTSLTVGTGIFWPNGSVYGGGSSGAGLTYTASASAPGSANNGDQWYNTTNDILYTRVNDGVSSFWLDISSLPSIFANVDVTGNLSISGNVSTHITPVLNNTFTSTNKWRSNA